MSASITPVVELSFHDPATDSTAKLDATEIKPTDVPWIKTPPRYDSYHDTFFSRVRLRKRRSARKSAPAPALMLIEKPLSHMDEATPDVEPQPTPMDVEQTRRLLNLIALMGITVALFSGCAVVALMSLIYGLQPKVPTGTILPYSGSAATLLRNDDQWLFCDGSAVSRTKYSALFLVIGTTYGVGNGADTFNLPDLRNRFLWGSPGLENDSFVSGGSATHTLAVDQLPPHNHTQGSLITLASGFHTHGVADPGHNHGGNTGPAWTAFVTPNNYDGGSTWSWIYAATGSHTHTIDRDYTHIQIQAAGSHSHTITGTTGNVGQARPIDKMPPYHTVHYIIRI